MKYDLVFEGGGAKGMVFVGAMQAFEAKGHTYGRLLGTSAGAITAALLAAGYSAREMLEVLNEKESGKSVFLSFLSTPTGFDRKYIENSVTYTFLQRVNIPLVPESVERAVDNWLINALMLQSGYRSLFSFVELGGWFSAHKFIEWMAQKLDSGVYRGQPRRFSQMTLAEFFAATGAELSVVASDTVGEQMLVLNHLTAPNCPLVWAVRMSMSIPLLWPEVEWQAGWGRYRNRDITGHLVVDGGLLSNFPLELFISDQPHVTNVMGPKQSEGVLGLLIDETLPVENAPANIENPSLDIKELRTVRRIGRLLNTALQANDKMVIDAFEQLVARLPAHGYGIIEFDMSDRRREALVMAGREKMLQYFDQQGVRIYRLDESASRQADKIATHLLSQ